MKLNSDTRILLAARARRRRIDLGLSCRALAEKAMIPEASIFQMEKMIPLKAVRDASWEDALSVPRGWLRDTSIPTPTRATDHFPSSETPWESFADYILGVCVWHLSPPHGERIFSLVDLPERERRIAYILARRYGSEGEEASTLQQIGDDLGLTRERVRQIAEKGSERLAKVDKPLDLLERLHVAMDPHLPCPLPDLDPHIRTILGKSQSLEGVDRFFREVLAEPLITITTGIGGSSAVQEKFVVAGDIPNADLIRAVRQAAVSMIRLTGAAQIYYVTGLIAEQGFFATPSDVASCARIFRGFEWLVEDEGWFWFGPDTDNRARSVALKVLTAANRPVDIEELYSAMARARYTKSADRLSPSSTTTPLPVLQEVLARFPEIRRTQFNDFRLADSSTEDGSVAYLSPSEAAMYELIKSQGGVASRRLLTRELTGERKLEPVTVNMALTSSPVFRRIDRGFWAITGFSYSYQALQRAQEETQQLLPLVDGWYEMEVSLPPSAFSRGDWFVPAAATPHLTPGEYEILGLPGTASYVINLVADPSLKRFGRIIAAGGFDMDTPYIFGISAEGRTLRLRSVLEEDRS